MAETETAEKANSLRTCYDKLRKAVGNIPMDASKSAKLQNLSSGKISEILPNLYLAGRTVAQNSELLRLKSVTTVINVSDREIPDYQQMNPSIRHYKFYPTSDTINAKFDTILDDALRLIHESRLRGEGVLVHCFLGVSRSVTLVAFYLITELEMKWTDAVDFIQKRRFTASPNFGFLHQLRVFSTTKAKESRQRLISEQCIQMRQSDSDVIKKFLPLAVFEL